MQKLYCYVDETGWDTKGRIYIVAIVVMRYLLGLHLYSFGGWLSNTQ